MYILLALFLLLFLLLLPQIIGETTAITSYLANTFYKNNFHEVIPKKVYRSSELTPEELENYIQQYNICSILDLRRGSDCLIEKEISIKNGAQYFHLKIHGTQTPSWEKLKLLFDIFDQAKTPILIHCSSGTHRSGVVSALWLLDKEKTGLEVAKKQLSHRYGFFYWERRLKSFFLGRQTIDFLIWKYKRETGGKIAIRDWAKTGLSFLEHSNKKPKCPRKEILLYD